MPLLFTIYRVKRLAGVMAWFFFMVLIVMGCLYERRDGSMDWVEDSKKWTVVCGNYRIKSVSEAKLYGKRKKL